MDLREIIVGDIHQVEIAVGVEIGQAPTEMALVPLADAPLGKDAPAVVLPYRDVGSPTMPP